MSHLDDQYIRLLSPRLDKFTKKNNTYNFRCPYCGDSKKNKNKTRGYLFLIKNDYVFKCHNCSVGRTFTNFLKDHDRSLYDRYLLDRYKTGLTGKGSQTPNPSFNFQEPKFIRNRENSIDLKKISELNTTHPAREYLENRKIKDLDYFYYCPKFKDWTNKQKKVFNTLRQDSARIIIPLKDSDGIMFGYQGRSLAPKAKIRYITVMLDESKPKIFGLDRINKNETIYITEGPFDSLFICNSIALCGADGDVSKWGISDCVWIYDNEPRNKQIVERIDKTIRQGNKVVIFPKNINEKDLNAMVLAGHDVQKMVESNTYQGLEAKLKLNEWKKV